LAGRYGLAFVRMLRERSPLFGGSARANCWMTGFRSDDVYDPAQGHGLVYHNAQGLSVLVWVWVDDFLIHGPTETVTRDALSFFLDLSVDVGLLCHPAKLTPPQQVVKYCGFEFDTRDIPSLNGNAL
jgi:hypothetical protein